MDVEKGVAATEAEGRRRGEEVGRLLSKVWMYSRFLSLGIMIAAIAPRLAPASSCSCPAACYDLRHRLTGVSFTVVTVVVQAMLARVVLERRPAPAPKLPPLAAWTLGVLTWMFVTMFCFGYLAFGVRIYYFDWVAVGLTSATNLAMAASTVTRYLA